MGGRFIGGNPIAPKRIGVCTYEIIMPSDDLSDEQYSGIRQHITGRKVISENFICLVINKEDELNDVQRLK